MSELYQSDVSGVTRDRTHEHKRVSVKVTDIRESFISGSATFDYHEDDDPEQVRQRAHKEVEKALRRAGIVDEEKNVADLP